MPFFTEDDPRLDQFRIELGQVELDWKPSFSQTLEAAIQIDNTVGAFTAQLGEWIGQEPTPDFNPFDHMRGWELYARKLMHARSFGEMEAMMRQIRERERHRLMLQQSSTVSLLAAELIAGVIDPINLIGGAAFLIGRTAARTVGREALRGTIAGVSASAGSEFMLSALQPERTAIESALNITAAGLLSGATLGAMALGRHANAVNPTILSAFEDDLARHFKDGPRFVDPGEPRFDPFDAPRLLGPEQRRRAPGIGDDPTVPPGGRSRGTGPDRPEAEIIFPDLPKGYQIKIGKNKVREGRRYVAASHNRKSKTITLDEDYIKGPMFRGKEWTKPKVKGVLPLPEDRFKTPLAWFNFVKMHEIMHINSRRLQDEALADYENRINKLALDELERAELIRPSAGVARAGKLAVGDDTRFTTDDDMAAAQALAEDNRLASGAGIALGIAKATSPGLRTLASTSRSVRNTAERLFETGAYLVKNFHNKASEVSVTTYSEMWRRNLGETLVDIDASYANYRKSVRERNLEGGSSSVGVGQGFRDIASDTVGDFLSKKRNHLSFEEFRIEITKALRRQNQHVIPQVSAVAKSMRDNVLTKVKDAAVEVKLIKADEVDPNYVPRIWDPIRIIEDRDGLVELIYYDQKNNAPEQFRKTRKEINAQLEGVLRTPHGIEGHNDIVGVKGIFKKRQIWVSSEEVIEDFLINDIDTVLRIYVDAAAVDIELTRKFGDVGMTKQIAEIKKEAADEMAKNLAKVAALKNDDPTKPALKLAAQETNKKLAKQLESNLEDLEGGRDILRGVYGVPDDPYSLSSRAARIAMEFNNLTMLGGATISSIPDMGRIIMVNGMEHAFPVLKALIKDWKTFKMSPSEAKLAGTAWDMQLQTRVLAMVGSGTLPRRFTRFERGMGKVTNAFFLANLLSPWNAFIKGVDGIAVAHRIVSVAISKNPSKADIAKLRRAGITPEQQEGIATMFKKHGKTVSGRMWGGDYSARMPNSHLWKEDPNAQRALQAAVHNDVDTTILTPKAGDQPLFVHKTWGRLFTQYKSFLFTSATRVAVPGMQMRDAAQLHGLMMMIFIGGVVGMLKDKMAGREGPQNVREFLIEGIDRSGVTGLLFFVNNALETFTDNNLGLRPAFGVGVPYSSSPGWKIGTAFGPSGSTASRLSGIISDIISGDVDYRTGREVGRLIPGQNLPYFQLHNLFKLRQDFDKVISGSRGEDDLRGSSGRDRVANPEDVLDPQRGDRLVNDNMDEPDLVWNGTKWRL